MKAKPRHLSESVRSTKAAAQSAFQHDDTVKRAGKPAWLRCTGAGLSLRLIQMGLANHGRDRIVGEKPSARAVGHRRLAYHTRAVAAALQMPPSSNGTWEPIAAQ